MELNREWLIHLKPTTEMFAVQNKINSQIVILDQMFYGAKRKFWNKVCAKHFGTISLPNEHFGT